VRDTTRDSRALYSVSLSRSGLPATSGSGRMPSVQALADSNRRPPPCHRATRPEPRAQAGHRGHESRARRRNRPKASDARTRRCPRWCSVSVPSLLPLESQSVRAGGPERLQGSRRYWLTRRLQRRESHMCLFRRLRPRPECGAPFVPGRCSRGGQQADGVHLGVAIKRCLGDRCRGHSAPVPARRSSCESTIPNPRAPATDERSSDLAAPPRDRRDEEE
jgi:hypothetical protein